MSHLIGVERSLLGDPAPPALAEVPGHVRNPIGEVNEAWIEARRQVPGPEVEAEFVDTTRRRLEALRSLSTADFDVVGWSPAGDVPYREFMETRVMDSWAHEQDIRRAVGRAGGRNGAGERMSLERCAKAMPYVVGKKAGAPDGSSVLFVVTGLMGMRLPVVVEGRRASVAEEEPADPTVTVTMDQELFWRVGFGRLDPTVLVDDGSIGLTGTSPWVARSSGRMPFMI